MAKNRASSYGKDSVKSGSAGRLRRQFLSAGILALIGGVLGKKAVSSQEKAPSSLVTEGEVLKTGVYQGRPPMEPLDTMIRFERSDNNNGRPITHEILSLAHEEKGEKSFPWTVYAHLTTHHVEGDAVVYTSRLHKENAGWSCGFHSEIFNSARAVGLGVNIETTNNYNGPEESCIIGMNVQAHGPYDCRYGIQIHDSGGHYTTAIGLNGDGKYGIDMGGKFGTGLNMQGNSIRMNEGACIELDGVGKVRMRYNKGRIEFLNGDKCVGHIDVNGEDHKL